MKVNLPSNILERIIHGKVTIDPWLISQVAGKIKFLFSMDATSSINGIPNGRNKIDVIGTLKSAAPWQLMKKHYQIVISLKLNSEHLIYK